MFGHQDDKKDDEKSSEPENVVAPDQPAEEAVATDTAVQADTTTAPADDAAPATDPPADTSSGDDNAWQHPGTPITDDNDESEEDEEEAEPEEDAVDKGPEPIKDIVGSSAGPDFKPFPQIGSDPRDADTENTPHELIDIKAKALDDLTPLVGQLDQSPEDKFRTIMMMIQAKDDQGLIQSAYAAAHEIKDEKVRAQALLDVVNEINYFTQHPEN